jgi:class 3 adenylate cyclase
MPRLQARSFEQPDDVREMPTMRFATIGLDEATVGHCRFNPGWRWSTDVAPLMGLTSCPIRHLGYSMAGRVHVRMDDGQTVDIGPDTVFDIPPGHDKWVVGDEAWETIEWGGSGRAVTAALEETRTRSFATILFTDIVGSTSTAGRVGDTAWRDLLAAHNARLRMQLNVFRGREVKSTGDGLLAVFDSPTRAVRCAAAMVRETSGTELAVRIGVHAGEIEVVGDDVQGIAVHVAARVLALGGPNEVTVSSTIHDLLEGSGLAFEHAGEHELKGLAGPRQVFRLATGRDDADEAGAERGRGVPGGPTLA